MKCSAIVARCLVSLLPVYLFTPAVAQPYYQRLDSETVSEAFQFGRHNDESVGIFLSKYVRTFPIPPKGPYIGRIEVRTPYAQVVYAAKDDLQNETEGDAVQKFDQAKLPVVVIVRVYWPPTNVVYSEKDFGDMWKRFPIGVSQQHSLAAQRKQTTPYHPSVRGTEGIDYTDMQLEFSVAKVSSEMLIITASSPDGQQVEAKFDLSKLK